MSRCCEGLYFDFHGQLEEADTLIEGLAASTNGAGPIGRAGEPTGRLELPTSRLQGERCYQLSYVGDEARIVVHPPSRTQGPPRPDQPVPPEPEHPVIVAMRVEEMTFRSESVGCAARVYRPDVAPGEVTPCIAMAGFSLTRDDGLLAFAEQFAGVG